MPQRSSSLTARFLIPASLLLPLTASLAADVTWNNPGSGAFTTNTNWTPNNVPGTSDTAIISNGTGTAELSTGQSASVGVLRVSNGSLTATDASVTTGITSSSWQSMGDLQVGGPSGTGSLTAGGASTINTGRVRIGGYNTSGGGDSANAIGTLSLSGSTTMQTSTGGGYDLWLGNGAGSSGTLNMSGTSQLTVNSSMTSGRAGGSGTVNLSGSSVMTVTTFANIGEGGTASWTVSDNASLATGGNLTMGGTSTTLTVEDSASLVVGGEFQIGNGGGNVGNVVLTGGSVTANSWTSIGRSGGTGSVTMSGDALLTKAGNGNLIVGDGTTGTLNVSGAASIVSDSDIWVGLNNGGNGTLTLSGGSAQTSGVVIVAHNNAAAQGTLNLNAGGTLTADALQEGAGTATVKFNGGTFAAGQNGADILSGFESGDLDLLAGGLTIDSNGNSVSASSVLSGVGGLTKTGAGALLLSGINTYTGDTVIQAGSLTLGASGVIADASAVTLDGGTLNINNFNETLAALTLGSTSTIDFGSMPGANVLTFADSSGEMWTGSLILSNFEVGIDTLNFSPDGLTSLQLEAISLSGYIATGMTGAGDVIFTAVPEPEHYAIGALAVLVMAILVRRRRLA